MGNSNIDKITNDILDNSALELKNPDFNSIIMKEIISKNRKQILFYNSLLYILIFIIFDIFIFLLLKYFYLSITFYSSENSSFVYEIFTNIKTLANIILGNNIIQYSIISLFIILIFNKLSLLSFKHS